MAKSKKTQAQLVQEQIDRSSRDVGFIKEDANVRVSTDIDEVGSVYTPTDSLTWARRTFVKNQTRCRHFDPTLSGMGERTPGKFGWCDLTIDYSKYPDSLSHETLDALNNWKGDQGGRCVLGEYALCSGYTSTPYYLPPPIEFRSPNISVRNSYITTDRGGFSEAIPQYTNSMYSIELYKNRPGLVVMDFSTTDPVSIFVSGHRKFTSGRAPNIARRFTVDVTISSWIRLDMVHYATSHSSRLAVADSFFNNIDGWRTPDIPAEVYAHYATFTRKDPGQLAKWSYILAHITPQSVPGAYSTISTVEIDWRAPTFQPAWHREIVDIDPVIEGGSYVQVSGVFKVPHTEDIELRSRAVDQWGDAGPWHTISGLTSAAGNIKPQLVGSKAVDFTIQRGISEYRFKVTPAESEYWESFILVSGFKHDHYIETNACAGADGGLRRIPLISTPLLTRSGMLISIAGGYESDTTGQLHFVTDVDTSGIPVYIEVKEPLTAGFSSPVTIKSYNIAKVTNATEFSLQAEDKTLHYFNMVGRNYNGGISAFAKDIADWETSKTVGTFTTALPQGPNIIKNGGLENPKYIHSHVMSQYPLNYWYVTSGFLNPVISITEAKQGTQSALWSGNSLYGSELIFGEHNGIQQDVYGAFWNESYQLSAWTYSYADYDTATWFTVSSLIKYKYELWAYDGGEQVGADFQYGELPPSAVFIRSGHYGELRAGYDPAAPDFAAYWNPDDKINVIIDTDDPGIDVSSKLPMLRVGFWLDDAPVKPTWPDYDAGKFETPSLTLDQISLNSIEPVFNMDDGRVTGRSFNWASMRLNEEVDTTEGYHLDIDSRYGLNTIVRRGNPSPINSRTESSLAGYAVSGRMDFPRLVYWAPNVASFTGSPSYYRLFAGAPADVMNQGLLIVPSGRAIFFDITPTETFKYASDEPVMTDGDGYRFIFPSGGHPLTAPTYPNEYFDPGSMGWGQRIYAQVNFIGGLSVNTHQAPIVASDGDLQINYIRIHATSGPLMPKVNEFWHVCDVKIYETSAPFVASGVNTTNPTRSNIGYVNREGLTYFPGTTTDIIE